MKQQMNYTDIKSDSLEHLLQITPSDAINTCMLSRINQVSPSEEEKKRQLTQKCLKCGLAILAFARALTFANLSLEVPKIGPACLVGNMIASTLSDTYFGSCVIDDLFAYKTPEEKVLIEKEASKCKQIALGFFCLTTVLLSQVPSILTAVLYNDKQLQIPVAMVNGIVGSMYPMHSMWLLEMEKLHNQKAKETGTDPSLLEGQKLLVQLIEKNERLFKSLDTSKKESFIKALNLIRQDEDSPEKIQKYLDQLLSLEETSPPNESTSRETADKAVQMTALIFTLIFLYAKGEFTWTETKDIAWNNDWVAGSFTALYEITSCYGTKRLIENAALQIFHSIADRNDPLTQKNLVEQLRTKQITALRGANYFNTILSLGVTYIIWKNFYANEVERNFFIATMSVAVFLIFSAATSKVIDGVMENRIATQGTPEEKAIMSLSFEFRKFAKDVKKTSPANLETLLSLIPDNIKQMLSKKENTILPDQV